MSTLFEINDLVVHTYQGHLWRRQKKQLLHGINLQIEAGDSLAYLGPNGAGKTTTFRAICGLSTQYSGTFLWQGKEVHSHELNPHIGFLPENSYLYPLLTPREIITGLGKLSGTTSALSKEISHWASRLNFEHVLDQPSRTCSKGQMQRVGLALALLHRPELLILDEPMSGLDPLGRECVRLVLKDALASGTSMILSSHILDDVEHLCDKVVAINHGNVIYSGGLNDMLKASDTWHIRLRTSSPQKLGDQMGKLSVEKESDSDYLITGSSASERMEDVLSRLTQLSGLEIIHAAKSIPRLEQAFVNLIDEERPS